ncbi:phasin family protein [Erythrobacter sp. sf7]|uniref:Phasin family protein n=1 Tax=Erythrobacter fulvus TaxID=2987523 RepID=A0ABT5JQQ2_9SPHN|nr:phasin family protein [Erythrobacter fulvus]MDC8754939.1 phasin family protein [Erythrobacter fulvus]
MSEVETTAAAKAPVAKIDAAAEKAYAEAAAKTVAAPKAEAAPAVKKPAAPKAVAKKPAAKKVVAKKPAAKKPAAPKKPVAAKKAAPKATKPAAAPKTNPVIKIKDTIMATAKNTDITATAKDMLADVQTRAKTAYAKTAELAGEAGEFGKANVEAVVESGKIFFAGAQNIVKSDLETGKAVLETVTEDAKKVAAIKSPTELMQLQGEIARRNFDAMVAFGSKRTETLMKLYNDAFAPISNRVSVAAEKISKAA